MKALVTGATGFLGRHLVQRLLQEGEEVWVLARTSQPAAYPQGVGARVVEGDVRRWSSLRRAVRGMDVVFHCAGKTEPTGRWVDFLEVNVLGTERVIQAALEHGVRRIVHVSSIGVYGPRPAGVVITEDDGYDPNPRARGFYTQSKIEADRIACWYAAERAAPVTVIRPGTIYGPGGKGGLLRAGVRLGPLNVVFGDGRNPLPLVYVANVVDALVLASRSETPPGRAFNIVDDDEVSQRLYVERMGPALGLQQSTVYLPLSAVRVLAGGADLARTVLRGRRSPQGLFHRITRSLQRVMYDTSRAKDELAWHPRVSFEEALKRMQDADPHQDDLQFTAKRPAATP
jgi:nucleoside-diphosphate-sugar epimerase